MDSKEASPSLEHLEQSKEEEQSTRRSTQAPSPDAEVPVTEDDGAPAGHHGSVGEFKHLRQVRGRHRAALTRIFRRAEALMKDGAASAQLENVREDMDSALEALMNTNECLEGYLEGEDEKADAAQYVADVRNEKRRIEEKIESYLTGIRERPQTGPSTATDLGERVEEERSELERRSPSLGRSMPRTRRSVMRRPMSQVSVSSAASRASAEAQISVRLKELRVRQLGQERKLREQEEQLRRNQMEQERRQERTVATKPDGTREAGGTAALIRKNSRRLTTRLKQPDWRRS